MTNLPLQLLYLFIPGEGRVILILELDCIIAYLFRGKWSLCYSLRSVLDIRVFALDSLPNISQSKHIYLSSFAHRTCSYISPNYLSSTECFNIFNQPTNQQPVRYTLTQQAR